jgi:hypothetical protein
MNTMADLRRECATRLRETVHGREIDMFENTVEIEHMLGIVPIGVHSNHEVEQGTILDPDHDFWTDYEETVRTRNAVTQRIESAIRSLKKDDIFTMTHPYGEAADIVYCEVEELGEQSDLMLPTRCHSCSNEIAAPIELEYTEGYSGGGSYDLSVNIDCPHCEFSRSLSGSLQRE